MLLSERITELPTDKPSGIQIKVADFGIFGSTSGRVAESHNVGSLKYMAPEILLGRHGSDPKIDVWSMGVLLYSMIMGHYPFDTKNKEDKETLKHLIIEKEIRLPRKDQSPKPRRKSKLSPTERARSNSFQEELKSEFQITKQTSSSTPGKLEVPIDVSNECRDAIE